MSIYIRSHTFVFKPEDNDGEALILETKFYDEGGPIAAHKLTLASHQNSASFQLHGIFLTPEKLRKLADELEEAERKARG